MNEASNDNNKDSKLEEASNVSANDGRRPKNSDAWQTPGVDGLASQTYYFYDNPLRHCCIFLLATITFVKVTWNSFQLTLIVYITGLYNPDWNAGFSPDDASSFIASTSIIAYTAPFIAAIAADLVFGDYWTIVFSVFSMFLGMLLETLTAVPELFGSTFNEAVLKWGTLVCIPIGSGIFGIVMNMFVGKQFHPIQQRDQLQKVFTWIYVCGAIAGVLSNLVIAILAQFNVVIAFSLNTLSAGIGAVVFLCGSARYVIWRPQRKRIMLTAGAFIGSLLCFTKNAENNGSCQPSCPGFNKTKKSNGGAIPDTIVEDLKRISLIIPVAVMVMPVTIVFDAMVQQCILLSGTMSYGIIGPAPITFVGNFAIIIIGQILNQKIYPLLQKRNKTIPIAHKLAFGSFFFGLAYMAIIFIFSHMQKVFNETGESVSIWWICIPYIVGAFGSLFITPPISEFTFLLGPTSMKTPTTALQKLISSGIGSVVQRAIFEATKKWFPDEVSLMSYVDSDIKNVWWLFTGISFASAAFFMFPKVKDCLEDIELYAQIQTALLTFENKPMMSRRRRSSINE